MYKLIGLLLLGAMLFAACGGGADAGSQNADAGEEWEEGYVGSINTYISFPSDLKTKHRNNQALVFIPEENTQDAYSFVFSGVGQSLHAPTRCEWDPGLEHFSDCVAGNFLGKGWAVDTSTHPDREDVLLLEMSNDTHQRSYALFESTTLSGRMVVSGLQLVGIQTEVEKHHELFMKMAASIEQG